VVRLDNGQRVSTRKVASYWGPTFAAVDRSGKL